MRILLTTVDPNVGNLPVVREFHRADPAFNFLEVIQNFLLLLKWQHRQLLTDQSPCLRFFTIRTEISFGLEEQFKDPCHVAVIDIDQSSGPFGGNIQSLLYQCRREAFLEAAIVQPVRFGCLVVEIYVDRGDASGAE